MPISEKDLADLRATGSRGPIVARLQELGCSENIHLQMVTLVKEGFGMDDVLLSLLDTMISHIIACTAQAVAENPMGQKGKLLGVMALQSFSEHADQSFRAGAKGIINDSITKDAKHG